MSTGYMFKQCVPIVAVAVFFCFGSCFLQYTTSYAASAMASATAEVIPLTKAALRFGNISPETTLLGPVGVVASAVMTDNFLTCAIRVSTNGTVTITHGTKSMAVNDFVSNSSGTRTVRITRQNLTVGTTLSVNPKKRVCNSCTGLFQVSVDYN